MNAPVTVLKVPQTESATPLISEELAHFVGAYATAAIPAAVKARAKHLILDAVGIALASTRYDFAHRALTAISGLAGAGDFAVIGMPARLPLRDAALINGILIHGLDFDDTHSGGVIHATSSVLPTVLAVGAQQRASGSEMLAAYILGVEVAARLGAVAKGAFHQVGFHPTGLIGAFACTLAAGRLMGLNEKQLVMAQGLTYQPVPAASSSWRTALGTSASIRAGRRLPASRRRLSPARVLSVLSGPMRAASASTPAICKAISIRPIWRWRPRDWARSGNCSRWP